MPAVEVLDVHREFRGTPVVHALRGVSFSVEQGEILGLLGVNGAGKTTLIKIISTLLHPTAGTARVCGHDVVREGRRAREHLSVVFGGEKGLYGRLSALDNLVFLASLHGQSKSLRARAREALAEVGLAERAGSRVETFSKGMRQRLHLACGLMVAAPVLLLDEPTVGLDLAEAERIRATVRRMADSGTAIVLTSHYPVDIEALADRIVLLQSGVVTHDVAVGEFRRSAGFVAEIEITGTGTPPAARDGLLVTPTAEAEWTARLRVREWNSDVMTEVASVLGAVTVTGVDIRPSGIDTVLLSLVDRSAASR